MLVLAVVLGTALGMAGAASAQGAGATVEVVPPWRFEPSLDEVGTDYEIMGLANQVGDVMLIGFLPSDVDLAGARDIFLFSAFAESLAYIELDFGSYGTAVGNVSYSLSMVNFDGYEYGIFTVVLGGRSSGFVESYFLISSPLWLGDTVEEAKASIRVNGVPVFQGVTGAGLQGFMDRNLGVTGGNPLPVGFVEAVSQPAPTEPPAPTPTQAPNAEFEDLGLVGEREYVSPQFDTEVGWNRDWAFDPDLDQPIYSDTREDRDGLQLVWSGDGNALFDIAILEASGATPANLVDYRTSPDYLEDNAHPDVEVLLDDADANGGAVLLRDYTDDGDEVVILHEAILVDGGDAIAWITLYAEPRAFSDAYADAEGITVDGDPAFNVFTQRQIDRAL